MQEGADFARWNHTAAIQATLANTVRDSKKRSKPFQAREFHPHILHAKKQRENEQRGDGDGKVSITILRDVFVEGASMSEIEESHGV